ncbi:hypothetical protein AB4125_07555 [Vibrio splendidus]
MIFPNTTKATASENGIAVATIGPDSPVTIITALSKMPSVLNPLLEGIIRVYDPIELPPDSLELLPETDLKIQFNSLILYADEVRELVGFMSLIENIIDSIDQQAPGSANRFLWAINKKYRDCKNRLVLNKDIDLTNKDLIHQCICSNADKLFDEVTEELFQTVRTDMDCEIEIMQSAQRLIVCYGFINCKVLERPDDC